MSSYITVNVDVDVDISEFGADDIKEWIDNADSDDVLEIKNYIKDSDFNSDFENILNELEYGMDNFIKELTYFVKKEFPNKEYLLKNLGV